MYVCLLFRGLSLILGLLATRIYLIYSFTRIIQFFFPVFKIFKCEIGIEIQNMIMEIYPPIRFWISVSFRGFFHFR